MKRLTIVAAMAITVAGFMTSCGDSASKPNLKSDVDTMSYAMGIAQSQGLREYLAQMEIDTTYMDAFIKGLKDGANAGEDKKKAAYYAGINIGQQISNRMVKGINHELFGNDSTKSISMKNLLAGFITGATGKKGLMTPEQAQQLAQVKMMEIRTKSIADRFSENKKAGEKWLEANKKKPGEAKYGAGHCTGKIQEPKDTSLVKVNYEGKLIDGKVFDSSYKRKAPITMRANQVIKGWTEALTRMPAGSVWEVYIPQELAYGDREQTEIKPFSTLIFKIELLEVDPKK